MAHCNKELETQISSLSTAKCSYWSRILSVMVFDLDRYVTLRMMFLFTSSMKIDSTIIENERSFAHF
jgi:hypothetical protein